MIVVDSSVWIDWIRGGAVEIEGASLRGIDPQDILVGDIVLLEVLRGAKDDRHAKHIQQWMSRFHFARMLDRDIALRAADNYRYLRGLGHTVRKTADLIIGTFCIERGHELLQRGRDFQLMATHLGLRLT